MREHNHPIDSPCLVCLEQLTNNLGRSMGVRIEGHHCTLEQSDIDTLAELGHMKEHYDPYTAETLSQLQRALADYRARSAMTVEQFLEWFAQQTPNVQSTIDAYIPLIMASMALRKDKQDG